MTARVAGADRQSIQRNAADAWLRIAVEKEAAGQYPDSIGAYKHAVYLFEKCGEGGQVKIINARIAKLQGAVDATNMPKRKAIRLPKRTLTTPRRGRGRPNGTTSGVITRGRVFDFIVAYKRQHDGNSPTSREIMDATDLSSTSVVHYHLHKLEVAGLIIVPRAASARSIIVCGGKWTFTQPEAKAGDEAE